MAKGCTVEKARTSHKLSLNWDRFCRFFRMTKNKEASWLYAELFVKYVNDEEWNLTIWMCPCLSANQKAWFSQVSQILWEIVRLHPKKKPFKDHSWRTALLKSGKILPPVGFEPRYFWLSNHSCYPWNISTFMLPLKYFYSHVTPEIFLQSCYPWNISTVMLPLKYFYSHVTPEIFLHSCYPWNISTFMLPLKYFYSHVTPEIFLHLLVSPRRLDPCSIDYWTLVKEPSLTLLVWVPEPKGQVMVPILTHLFCI